MTFTRTYTQTPTNTETFTSSPTPTLTPTSTPIGIYTVRIGVYNEAGELIKLIYAKSLPEPMENITLGGNNSIRSLNGADHSVTVLFGNQPVAVWDGSAQDGSPVSNGAYYIKVDNIDPSGVDKSISQVVAVSRSLLQTSILIYNEAGEVVRHLYAWTDDPGAASPVGAQLSSGMIQPGGGGGAPGQLTITLSNGVTVVWDGKGDNGDFVLNGQYMIGIHSFDGQGTDTTVNLQVTVLNALRDMASGILAVPNILDGAQGFQTTFQDNSAPGLTLSLRVYTLAGELIKDWDGTQGTSQTTWNAQGMASGVYLAVVGSRDAKGQPVHRRILKIAVIH